MAETATVLDGRKLAREIKEQLAEDVARLRTDGAAPSLVSLQVGESDPSRAYLESQKRSCAEVGIYWSHVQLDKDLPERDFLAHVDGICKNPCVTGLIIQLPVPKRLNVKRAYRLMDPVKDVEGMHPANLGSALAGEPGLAPCTALAVLELLRSTGVPLRGKEAVVVGHSQAVGKPISMLLLREDATVSTTHVETRDLAAHTRRADILVVAAGVPGLVTAEMVKPGAIVIDVGLTYVQSKPQGDVRFDEVKEVARSISPVPGGVGPVTVAMLLRNTVLSAKQQSKRRGDDEPHEPHA